MTTQLYSLSRKEGWRRYVEAPARVQPERLTIGQLTRLSDQAREDYDETRHDWHANFGILRTPQLAPPRASHRRGTRTHPRVPGGADLQHHSAHA